MPASVTLQICNGPMRGTQYVYEDRTMCILGRAEDCEPRLLYFPEAPEARENRRLSRHHCLLDINPPDVRIRDFGSLNGTFVNGKKIGQRGKAQTPEEGAHLAFPEFD